MLVFALLVVSVFGARKSRGVMRNDDNGLELDVSGCVDCPSYVALDAREKMDRLWAKIEADEYTEPFKTQCAREGGNCPCDGSVKYGKTGKWTAWRPVIGHIVCSASEFDGEDPAPWEWKKCVCKHSFPKTWIGLLERNLKDTGGRVDNGTMAMFFDRFSDENPRNNAKTIHTFGSTAKVRFVPQQNNMPQYTGMFAKGAEHALIRLSIVADWEQPCKGGTDLNFDGCVKPSLAFKMLRDGDYSSNTVAQKNLGDGVEWNFDFFRYTHATLLPAPHGIGADLVKSLFKHAAPENETNGVGLQELASDGSKAEQLPSAIVDPKVLFFVPSNEVMNTFSNDEHDPRSDFGKIVPSTRLYDVYTVNFQDLRCSADGQPVYWDKLDGSCPKEFLGHVETVSRFVASAYEDHRLFFQHERITKGGSWLRKMCKKKPGTGVQGDGAEFRMAGDFSRTCYQDCWPSTRADTSRSCPFHNLEQ